MKDHFRGGRGVYRMLGCVAAAWPQAPSAQQFEPDATHRAIGNRSADDGGSFKPGAGHSHLLYLVVS
jgi:hypothetical protein